MTDGAQPLITRPADTRPLGRPEPFPFLGRSRELAALRRVLRDARQSAGKAALVRGEAGIGKTRLLAEILAQDEKEGFEVLSGTTDELASDQPLGALIEAFGLHADSADPERATIGRLITGETGRLEPIVAADLGFRIIDESVALLEQLATDRPVVVAFEDLHWADPSTLRAVRAIGRALPDLPVALLVTLRPFPERSELAQVIEELESHGAAELALADEVGTRLHAPLLHGAAAWVALQRGDIAAGETRMVDAQEEFTAAVSQDWQLTAVADGIRMAGARWPLEWGLWIQALLCEARGDTGQARALLEDAWDLAAPLRFCLSYRFLGPDLVRLAVAAGDREQAAAVAQEVADDAQRSGAAGAALPRLGRR